MSITLDLPAEITAALSRQAAKVGVSPGDFITEALRRQLAVMRLSERRERLQQYGAAAGLTTDEAVFDAVS